MSEQFEMKISGGATWTPSKLTIIHTDTHTLVDADSVYVVIQSDIDLRRQLEIFEAQKFLIGVVRSDNLFGKVGQDLYVYSSMGTRHGSVEYAGDISGVSLNDVVIGFGANVCQQDLGGSDEFNQMLDSAFRMIREYIQDEFLGNTPAPTRDYGTPAATITNAIGTNIVPATIEFSGTEFWKRGTIIDIQGTTDAGPYGLTVTLPMDMYTRQMMRYLSEDLKGWNQSSFIDVVDPADDTVITLAMVAGFGGMNVEFTSVTVT